MLKILKYWKPYSPASNKNEIVNSFDGLGNVIQLILCLSRQNASKYIGDVHNADSTLKSVMYRYCQVENRLD